MYAPYAVDLISDGTFTQDSRVYRPPLAPHPVSVALHQLLCDEVEDRTRLACDALTDFQRIVSLCVAERHGRWSFSLSSSAPDVSGWCCPQCGYTAHDAEHVSARASAQQKGAVDHRRSLFVSGGCTTPCCTAEELRSWATQCEFATDASALLERRYVFQQEVGGLLQRIRTASRGIQDSVTR